MLHEGRFDHAVWFGNTANAWLNIKAELIRHQGPWHGLDDVEYATLEYVDWFNHRRLHGELGLVPPAEFEAAYYERGGALPLAASQ